MEKTAAFSFHLCKIYCQEKKYVTFLITESSDKMLYNIHLVASYVHLAASVRSVSLI